jgi:hypothetical protein
VQPRHLFMVTRTCLPSTCVLLLSAVVASAQTEPDLLALVVAGHRTAEESIQTLACTVKSELAHPVPQSTTLGQYWRSRDKARIHLETPSGTIDYYYFERESEIREIARNRKGTDQPEWLASRRAISRFQHPADAWYKVFGSFSTHLRSSKGTARAARERVDGRDCIRVTMQIAGGGQSEFSFDVARNYLIRQKVIVDKNARNINDPELVEWQPGVFFPTRIVGKNLDGRRVTHEGAVVFADLRVNEPIPESIFEMPTVPRGTRCEDYIVKEQYPIDSAWRKIPGSQTEPIQTEAVIEPAPKDEAHKAQSAAEPGSWTRWIAPFCALTLAVSASIWLYRRRKAASGDAE